MTRYTRSRAAILLFVAAISISAMAVAELQNVIVGGSIRIRGNWYSGSSGADKDTALRYPAQPGRLEVDSPFFGWNDSANTIAFVEQRTKLNVKADFTDSVSAFIEFDSYDVWGENFRSNYLTGVDSRGAANISLYQAYIDVKDMFGQPLELRVGRQEMKFGSGWLVAPNDTAALFYGTSFDGIRLTYATDQFSVDGFATKLADNSPIEQDGDVDFYGIYASYKGIENVTLDAYWMYLRDARSLHDVDAFGLPIASNYDPTNLHTIGLRGNGTIGGFDFEAEVAYQFGSADAVGSTFAGAGVYSPYGPTNANFDNFGANLELGYTFDINWKPRVFIGGAYLGGEDNRGVSYGEWLGALHNPYWRANSSVSFNRLFSSWEYSEFVENTDLSNAWILRTGVSFYPVEALKVAVLLSHYESLEDYAAPLDAYRSYLTKNNSSNLGTEAEIIATYNYSADLSFEVGYSHLFVGDGLREGNFNAGNGLIFNGGTDGDDADFVYFETKLAF